MASLLVVGVPAAAHAQVAALGPVPDTGCTVFPADSIWNTRVDALPVHPKSAAWLASMQADSTNLHPDFGPPNYGLPYDVVSNRHRTVRIRFRYAGESDRVRYPFGPRTPIENGSDRHALVVNKSTCTMYELFDADWNHGNPTAGSGAVFDLSSNALRPDGWTSADAAGLPILPGLVRFDEVKAGAIGHAIRFTAQCTRNRHLWPARHDAGTSDRRVVSPAIPMTVKPPATRSRGTAFHQRGCPRRFACLMVLSVGCCFRAAGARGCPNLRAGRLRQPVARITVP